MKRGKIDACLIETPTTLTFLGKRSREGEMTVKAFLAASDIPKNATEWAQNSEGIGMGNSFGFSSKHDPDADLRVVNTALSVTMFQRNSARIINIFQLFKHPMPPK